VGSFEPLGGTPRCLELAGPALEVEAVPLFGSSASRCRLSGHTQELELAVNYRFRQMLVITHVTDIAELCDSQIEVSLLEPGRSLAVVT